MTETDNDKPVEWEKYSFNGFADNDCSTTTDLFGLFPTTIGLSPVAQENNKRMLFCTNANVNSAGVMNDIDIPANVTELPISFDWRMMSQDLTAAGGTTSTIVNECFPLDCSHISPRNDRVLVQLINVANNQRKPVFNTDLNSLKNTSAIINPAPGWYANNWQTASTTITGLTPGKYKLRVQLYQMGSDATGTTTTNEGTSLFMMDRVRFRLN